MRFTIALACLAVAAPVAAQPRPVFPQDLFARVNGVSLHYLDWGGTGDLMLMLPGWGHTAYTWAGIAPAFTDRFHVVGLTRRGHGASDKPETGFTVDALVEDIVAFIEAMGARRVILVGHSFAGREMPLVAARLGDRVRALVFVDAVYEWTMMAANPATANINRFMEPPDSAFRSYRALDAWYAWRDPATWNAVARATLRSQTYLTADGRVAWQLPLASLGKQLGWMATTGTDYAAVTVPTLAIWTDMTESVTRSMTAAGYGPADVDLLRQWASGTDVPMKQAGIKALQRSHAPVTVIPVKAPHLVHWANPGFVIRELNRFLKARALP